MVKLNVPVWVGLPVIMVVVPGRGLSRVRPGGRLPATTDQVVGPLPRLPSSAMVTSYEFGWVVWPKASTHTLPSTVPPVGAPAQLKDGARLARAGAGATTADSVPTNVAAAPAVSAARLVSLIAILLRSAWRRTRAGASRRERPLASSGDPCHVPRTGQGSSSPRLTQISGPQYCRSLPSWRCAGHRCARNWRLQGTRASSR